MSAFTGPLDPEHVIERLRAQTTTIRLVEGAADYEAAVAAGGPRVAQAAYVLLDTDVASKPQGYAGGPMVQQAETRFAVVIAARNLRASDAGGTAVAGILPLLRDVRAAVIGWRHPEASGACTAQSGGVLMIAAGVLWWREIFRAPYRQVSA